MSDLLFTAKHFFKTKEEQNEEIIAYYLVASGGLVTIYAVIGIKSRYY
ncbi:hypothetical protein [Chitinophaga silvisoli]|nr:hypothetical protein [Chitinophaga silvisoli]